MVAKISLFRTIFLAYRGMTRNTPIPTTKNNACGNAFAANRLLLRIPRTTSKYRRFTAVPALATRL